MTDDMINDLVSGTAKAHDADFGSLAIYAALKAATEDRIHMPDDLIDTRPDGSGAPPARPYIAPPDRGTPRPQRRLLLAVAAIALVAAGIAGAVFATDDDTPRETDKATSTTVPEATIEERIVAAYRAAYADNVEHRTFTYADKGVTYETWTDDRTGLRRFRTEGGGEGSLKGKPSSDEGPLRTDDTSTSGVRRIDHCFREYTDDPTASSGVPSGTEVDEMQRALDEGRLVVEGERELDGRATIRLRYDGAEPREGYVWLDATTLLPFRAEGQEDSDGAFVETTELLPRSAENLETLVPPVPAGYTKVDQLRDPDAGAVAGC